MCRGLQGWVIGLEPTTTRITIWDSNQSELHPPLVSASNIAKIPKIQRVFPELFFTLILATHQTDKISPFKIIAVFVAEPRIDKLLRKHLDFK